MKPQSNVHKSLFGRKAGFYEFYWEVVKCMFEEISSSFPLHSKRYNLLHKEYTVR
jgi:hypothetical protein